MLGREILDYAVRRKLPLLFQERQSQQEALGEAAGQGS